MSFFNTQRFTESHTPPERCPGCGKPWGECKAGAVQRKRFNEMCGLTWPDCLSINYPLRKDSQALGIPSDNLPRHINLCIACSIAYMQEFNRRFKEKKRQRRA
jgi:hypothetical protein